MPTPEVAATEPRKDLRFIRSSVRRSSTPPRLAGREVRPGDIRIQLDPVARLVLDMEVAVLPKRTFVHDQVRPPVYPFGKLVNAKLAHGRGRVATRNGADRAGR